MGNILRLYALVLLMAMCVGCGGGSQVVPPAPVDKPSLDDGQAPGVESPTSEQLPVPVPRTVAIVDALAELEALPIPESVDPELFASIKNALSTALQARTLDKFTSAAPTGGHNKVVDLAPLDAGETAIRLKWKEVNTGDYDLNGEVNVSDITPIVMYFGKARSGPDWSIAKVADGDGNGEVNIADITPIVMNFMNSVAGYRIYRQAEGADEPVWLGTVPRDEALLAEGSSVLYVFADPVLDPTVVYTYTVSPFVSLTEAEGVKSVKLAAAVFSTYGLFEESAPDTLEIEIDGVMMTVLANHVLVEFNGRPTDSHLFNVAYNDLDGAVWGKLTESDIYRIKLGATGRQSSQLIGKKATSATDDYILQYDVVYKLDDPIDEHESSSLKGTSQTYSDTFRYWQWGLDAVHANDAWDITEGDYVRVAVIDSGVDNDHPDLDYNVDPFLSATIPLGGNWWEDYAGHGTHVAGIIAAEAGNNEGVVGLANKSVIIAIKIGGYGSDGIWSMPASQTREAIYYAVNHGADVINMSFGRYYGPNSRPLYYDALTWAFGHGVVVVAAAGNGGPDHIGDSAQNVYPADHPVVISVAALNQNMQRRPSSNWGYPDHVFVCAPGGSIYSTVSPESSQGALYGYKGGTSMAAPHVSALAAMILAVRPGDYDGSPAMLMSRIVNPIQAYARNISTDKPIGPLIDAHATLLAITQEQTYSITGRLTSNLGVVFDHRVVLTPGNIETQTWGAMASYSFNDLEEGAYWVTPDPYEGYTWDVPTKQVFIGGVDIEGIDFHATEDAPDTYSITGNLNSSGGVPMFHPVVLTPGNIETSTNVLGNYGFSNLPNNDTYTVTPGALLGYSWDNLSRNVTISGADRANIDFNATQDNSQPNIPNSPNPDNFATGISINTSVAWAGGDPDGDIVTYDVYFGTSTSPPQVSSGQSSTSYNPPGSLNNSTMYYWKVVAEDEHGLTATGPVWRFTTESDSATWHTYVVDSAGNTGYHTSLAIVDGNPAISYFDYINRNLMYVRSTDASGSSWEEPVAVDTAPFVGWYTSLAVVNGYPAISYYDYTNADLKYVRATDASGNAWGTPVEVVTTDDSGQFTSLVVVDGNPAISYWYFTAATLKYVRATNADGSNWGTPVTVDFGDLSAESSLAIVDGNPAISYWDGWNEDLMYVRATNAQGSTWNTPVAVDTAGYVGLSTSLAVMDGNPAISYWDGTNSDLKYVRATDASGSSWGTPLAVDTAGSVGSHTSMAVVGGYPAISYYDGTNGDLKYVRATNASGSSWATPVAVDTTGDVGRYTSLMIVNSNPAISYYDGTNGDLKYARWY